MKSTGTIGELAMRRPHPGTGPDLLRRPDRVRTRHLWDPHYPRGFRISGPLREHVAPHKCTCDSRPGKCPWHLGRFGGAPRPQEEHKIPRIHGISPGAYLLFCALHRGAHWALAEGLDYSPGVERMRRYIGAQIDRNRPRDSHGQVLRVGPRYERGSASESTVIDYMNELRGARMADGLPLVASFRHPNAPASVWIHPEVLLDPADVYTVTMAWDVSTTVPSGEPGMASELSPTPLTSLSEGPPSRLGRRIPNIHPEMGIHTIAGLQRLASVEPWWEGWVRQQGGSHQAARADLYRSLRSLRDRDVPGEDIQQAYALLTWMWTSGRQPDHFGQFLIAAARHRYRIPGEETPAETIASRMAAEQAARSAIQSRAVTALAAALPPDSAAEVSSSMGVERELTDEEHRTIIEQMRAKLAGERPPGDVTPGMGA